MFDWMEDIKNDDASFSTNNGPYIPEASDCMRCGLCISLCPTYKVSPIEAESPRSRIRTIDKIINDTVQASIEEIVHLNNCTQCRACETICPSQMAYGNLFDQAREKLVSTNSAKLNTHFLAPLGFKLIENKMLFSKIIKLISVYQKVGIASFVKKTPLLRLLKLDKADALLPEVSVEVLIDNYPTSQAFKGTVALFTGCLGAGFDIKTVKASIKTLNAIGYSVLIPQQQGCCGALHQHQGQSETADRLAINNLNVFNELAVDAIIFTSSACGLMLKEYEQKESLLKSFTPPLFDISEFLCKYWPAELRLNDSTLSKKTIAVHEPCSQRNVSKVSDKRHDSVYQLLAKIPGLNVQALEDNQTCCGAGGVHCLTHPEIAEPLKSLKLSHFQVSQADILVTTNIGCALHLNTELTSNKVIHPIVLLAEQLNLS